MADINHIFESFNGLNILVIGDVMIDSYIWGRVDRISPEAPVPVVVLKKREERLGGAGNVILNIKALGANPIICSYIGADDNGKRFLEILDEEGISKEGLLQSNHRPTTVKTRIIGNNHQMLRVDEETEEDIDQSEETALLERIKSLTQKKKIAAVVFQDYNKGVISESLIESVVNHCKSIDIPVIADPKKKNFLAYKNITLFKPNLKELTEGLHLDKAPESKEDLDNAATELQNQLSNKITLITLSDKGIYYNENGNSTIVTGEKIDVSDVSGAGDTVISIVAACVALNVDLDTTSKLANLAGGQVCEKVGVVPVDKTLLLEKALKLL